MTGTFGPFEVPLADHYRFDDEIGHGAMGTVYRARDLRLDRPVAIKILHPALTSDVGIRRFQSEIRIIAALQHPNIVAVHDCGEADGRLFYVMDCLEGETLRVRIAREKQLDIEPSIRIARQVADALRCAHDHHVVHRDVTPENIVLTAHGACIVDFGLARVVDAADSDRLTESGITIGTPKYLSPEQAQAQRDVGPPADQYALACILYEMLVGEPPFNGPTAVAIAMRHAHAEPTPLLLRRASTPMHVNEAVMRALRKLPTERYADIGAFAAALRSSGVKGNPEGREREATPSSLWGRIKRHVFGIG
ncbi:MAG: serine/threonine protein kinase [Gemmatimonadota bacterium]|nr:serine/threonine protein kinase [Gemmatimonadota bacterium]